MSKDALAGVYAAMLNDQSYREKVAKDSKALHTWDLTDEEKKVLRDEAKVQTPKLKLGEGPVMEHLSKRRGPALSPAVASALGEALNRKAGLPTGALDGHGFLSNAACCPWNHGVVADPKRTVE